MQQTRVAVIGGGSFGTTLARVVAENGFPVTLWLRNQDSVCEVNQRHTNSRYLPDIALPESLVATSDMAQALAGVEAIFMAVPSQYFREVGRQMAPLVPAGTVLLSTTKGIEAEGFKLMSQVLAEEIPQAAIGAISGPNLAREIAAKQLTGTVIASPEPRVVQTAQSLLRCSYLRVYSNPDMYGAELGGALKNIYAIISGMGAALGIGDNTRALLITRSLAEMSRFAARLGANPMTFMGLSGMGDLMATCLSPLSRNYRVGYEVGQGRSLEEVVSQLGQVAEGVNTLRLVKHKADELGVYMPLVSGLYEVLINGKAVMEVVGAMMSADQNTDVEFVLG